MKTVFTVFHLMLFLGCTTTIHASGQTSPDALLLQTDVEFARMSEESDPKTAFARYLAPNAMMLPRRGDPLEGYENALASFGEKPDFFLRWQPLMAEVAVSGEMGWTWGTYQVIVDDKQVSRGKYVNIWMLQPDGSWKVRLDMGNQEPAQETPDENQ